MTRRASVMTAGLIALLAIAAGLVWTARLDARRVAQQAQQDLAEGRRLILAISAAEQNPRQFADRGLTQIEAARLIEAACQDAALSPDCIARIWPEAPRPATPPLGDIGYQTAETQVLIRNAPLPELTVFLDRLTRDQPGLRVHAIRLAEDRRSTPSHSPSTPTPPPPTQAVDHRDPASNTERWNAEVTLQQTFFSESLQSLEGGS